MALPFYNWSRTAASNATADSTVNWAEGQAPSTVNDSARAMMASTAAFRDDIAGAIVTTGTSTAYAVTSYQVYDSLAHLNGQMIAFTPHATNGATVTLNVDGLGAKPLRSSPGVELTAGTLVLGTPYTCLYNSSDSVFYLHNFYGANPYNVPLGSGMDYWLATAPNSSFVFPIGQAISRTTYATLFAAMGTGYGVGDGSTTFNLPDKRGRVSAAADGGTGRLGVSIGGFVGAVGGSETVTLTTAQLAAHSHSGTTQNQNASHTHNIPSPQSKVGTSPGGGAFFQMWNNGGSGDSSTTSGTENQNHAHDFITNNAGGGTAHNNTQPTIVCNYIIRVL